LRIFHFGAAAFRLFGEVFDGQVVSADLDFICSASSDRSRRRISAADMQLMRFAIALKIYVMQFHHPLLRRVGVYRLAGVHPVSFNPSSLKSGQITC